MQIAIRPASVGANQQYTVIADSINQVALLSTASPDVIDFKPPSKKFVEQIEPLYGSPTQFVANRGNALWTLQIPIRQWFANNAAARAAIEILGAALDIGTMDLEIVDPATGSFVYMPACSCSGLDPDQAQGEQNIAVFYILRFTGPNYTANAP